MIEPGAAFGIAALIAAVVLGAVVGLWRGIHRVDRKTRQTLESLVAAQELRIEHLERDNRRMAAKVEELEDLVNKLRADLELERKITARIKP